MTGKSSAVEVKQKYFNMNNWQCHILRVEEHQIDLLGRKFESGDVVLAADGYLVQGKTLHTLELHVLIIPLSVSADFENVVDELRHMCDEKLSFSIACLPTDKSVMSKIGAYPNCYWNCVWLRFVAGELDDYAVHYLDCNRCYRGLLGQPIDEHFDQFCGPWSSMLAVVERNVEFGDSGRSEEKNVFLAGKSVVTPTCTLSVEGTGRIEVHFGPSHEIAKIRHRIEGDPALFKRKHIEVLENGTKFDYESTISVFKTANDGSTNERRWKENVVKIATIKHDIYKNQSKYFHRVILDVCIALAPFNIPNYEIVEIIHLLPGLRHNPNYHMMKTIFSVNESIRKVREQRAQMKKKTIKIL